MTGITLDGERRAQLEAIAADDDDVVALSAVTGEGVGKLLDRIDALLTSGARPYEILLPSGDGRRLAWLHQHGQVLSEKSDGENGEPGTVLTVRLTPREYGRFLSL